MRQLISVCLFSLATLMSFMAAGQHLFGNPSCSAWTQWSVGEKNAWLNAFLVPLNMTNMARKKLKVDLFSQLDSMAPVISHVNAFCDSNTEAMASIAAVNFLDEMTSEKLPK